MSKAAEIDLMVSDYSEKSLKVEGAATKGYLPEWKALGGRFNNRLKGGAGWIFPKTKETELVAVIDDIRSGVIEPSDPLRSSTLSLIDKVSNNIRNLSSEDRRDVFEYMKSTFHFT